MHKNTKRGGLIWLESTIVENIFSLKLNRPVSAKETVWLDLDLVWARDFGGPNSILLFEKTFPKKVFDPQKIAFTFDLQAPSRSENYAKNHKLLRDFSAKYNIKNVFDINCGVGQLSLLESGLVKPADVIIGTDSHANLLGAVCSFAVGVGNTEVAVALFSGKMWFKVPQTVKVVLNGQLKKGVSAKDVILSLLKDTTPQDFLFKAIEFEGSYVENTDLSERITLCSMVTELGGVIGFIFPSERVINYIAQKSKKPVSFIKERLFNIKPGKKAKYVNCFEFDVSDIPPMIALPHSPNNVKPVSSVEGIKIDQVHIGSCTNGSYMDIKEAFLILQKANFKISKDIRLIITPATKEVALLMAKDGITQKLIEAGAVVTNPSCSLCTAFHYGVLAEGEVCVSTSNRNFDGKVGKGAKVYLASPQTAAASAVFGKITDPRKIL